MAYLEINQLKKIYKEFTLDVTLSVEKGELLSIIGPSGSGKSTTLSLLAGIEKPDSGSILLDGVSIQDKPIQDREIGMVFQDYALFPSMNVEKNIEYGMKIKDKKERRKAVKDLLNLVGLPDYEKRSVSKLSGGEAQRVALARALASQPKILLLDEPLSALDAPLRKRLRSIIRTIQENLGITMIYVTHDREEAFAISDRILIMDDGKSIEVGSAEELYSKPKTLFTAFFTGEGTSLPASLFFEGSTETLFFRPEHAAISEGAIPVEQFSSHIVLNGVVIKSAEFIGDSYMLGLDYLGYPILARSILKPRQKDVSLIILKDSIQFF